MKSSAFPALYQAADDASKRAQQEYILLFRFSLGLLLLGALLGSLSLKDPGWKDFSSLASAFLVGASLVTSTALKIRAPEKTWFGGRAVAESVKSITWRFMVGGEPFIGTLPEQEAASRLCEELKAVLKERRSLSAKFSDPADALQITDEMTNSRTKSTEQRLEFYLQERVKEQREWYRSKAVMSQSANDFWFWATTAGQFAALLWAIWMVRAPDTTVKLTGFFSAVASSAVAWVQMKRYQDTAQAYAMAAHELGMIEVKAEEIRKAIRTRSIQTHAEELLASFVADAENAISREHTMWVARRDVG